MWKNNISALKSSYPGLFKALSLIKPEENQRNLEILAAANGSLTLKIDGVFMHSGRAPEREALRLASAAVEGIVKDGAVLAILGFGLGYSAEAAAELSPTSTIIIVEKDIGVLKKALETRDLKRFLARGRDIFIVGGEGGAFLPRWNLQARRRLL